MSTIIINFASVKEQKTLFYHSRKKKTNKQDFVLNRFPSIQGFFEVVLRDLYRIFGIFGSFSGSLKCKSLRWDIPFREVGAIISSSMYVRKPTSAGIPNTAAKKKKKNWPGCCCSCFSGQKMLWAINLKKYFNDKLEEIWTISFKMLRSEIDVRAHLYRISLCRRVLLAAVTKCS